jgi:amino acid adenylation domain-containing protein
VRQDAISSRGPGVLSISQQRLWVLDQLHPRNPAHNVFCGVRLTGSFDPEALGRAWREVVRPYDILRTEFRAVEGLPQPFVTQSFPELGTVELEFVVPEERGTRLSRLAREEARRPFDLSSGPLLRASFWRVAPLEYVFLLVAHRIVCDEASLGILLRQLASRYGTDESGKEQAAVQLPMQYSEYVSRQGKVSEEQISYWKNHLAGAPASLDLPSDRPRALEQSFRGASHCFSIRRLDPELLRNPGQGRDVPTFVTLLAAFNVLLSRYSRQDDVVVGTPVLGRSDPELENLVGPVENVVTLRADLSGNPRFSELLTRILAITEEAFSHQDVPFELLLEQLPLEMDLSRNPLFQAAFRLRPPRLQTDWGSGRNAIPFEMESGTERFDVSLDLVERPESIEGKLSYNADLFDPATMVRMSEHFCTLLTRLAADPARRICDISPLAESERCRILDEFNATSRDYRRHVCIHDFFEEQVERTPEATALTCEHEHLTYRELNSRANQVAHYLRRQGVGPEVLVGICLERSIEMLVGILGILKAGGAYIPLDPAYPKDRLAAILEDSKSSIILTQQTTVTALPDHVARIVRLDADRHDIAAEPATNPIRNVTSSNLGYVLFTSGSTGRPKGVALEHRSAATFIQWAREVFLPEEVAGTLFSTSVCFDLSVFEMFVPLSMGGRIIIAQNALALPKLASADDVTLINTVPSAIAELVRMAGVPSSVRVVNLAGEALPDSLAQQIYEKTGVRKVYNLYGPTEDTTYSTYTLVPRGGEVTIGRPLPNTQVYILDESRHLLPIGIPGELYLAGEGLARGYFGREDLTRERFVPNPFAKDSSARLYRTGDVARFLADGNIQYLGRIDNQVKLRGFRIELGEIETVLTKHPSVQSAVVIVREDSPGDRRLVAYVVPSRTSSSEAFLKDLVRKELPEYMVPSAVVQLNALPLSPNGKINRRMLPAPDWSAVDAKTVQPRNELESTLLSIWQSVLGVQNIGVRDNFFDVGGHSLTAARVLAEVEKTTGVELPLSALFRGSTVESMARLCEQGKTSDPVVVEIQSGDASRLPFFAIVPPGEESLGYAMLARHMGSGQTVYKIQGDAPIVDSTRPYSNQEMRDLTEQYIAAMRTVQPHGPYCLGGLCDGTHIAEQIVLSLEARREEVGFFAIFDTWVMQHSQRRWLWKVDYYRQRLKLMKGLSIAERVASYKRVAEKKAQTWLGKTPPRTDWEETYWPKGFTPARFEAPVVLFKRPKQQFYYINDPQMGWGQRSKSGVEVHEVDFHHQQILREPHVRLFGETLAVCMERVNRRRLNLQPSANHQQPSLIVSGQQVRQGS